MVEATIPRQLLVLASAEQYSGTTLSPVSLTEAVVYRVSTESAGCKTRLIREHEVFAIGRSDREYEGKGRCDRSRRRCSRCVITWPRQA
jgi:hypothetical protein